MNRTSVLATLAMAGCLACEPPRTWHVVFLDGRGIEAVGDSLVGYTAEDANGLLVLDLKTGQTDTLGAGELDGPVHVQHLDGRWYVSGVSDGTPSVTILTSDGELDRRVDLTGVTTLPHQFAVLPNGRMVVQGRDSRLVTVTDDSTSTFALTDIGTRPSLLVAASGGVLHAVPDHHITLYNGFGNVRWRVEWPWVETAFISDLAVDRVGRVHLLSGMLDRGEGTFLVYSMVQLTGEVIRWSEPGPHATFVVNGFGEVRPDSTANWTN